MTDTSHVSGAIDHVLPDGTTIRIRPITPADAPRLLDMWQRLSERTIRYRFLGAFTLTPQNVRRFTDLDPRRQYALVATTGRGDDVQVLGVSRYERLPDDPATAEFAVLVEDAHHDRGIGTALLRHVVEAARAAGVQRVVGDVLAENVRMLQVIEDLGLDTERARNGSTVHASVSIAPTAQFLEKVASDEKRAAHAALERFFRPRSVAVVGASRDPMSIGGLVFANILRGGYTGTVYPVNPSAPSVQSVAAYARLSDLPAVPDLVIVAVPARFVNDGVDETGSLGVRAVCIVSAGFAEAGEEGVARQEDLLERAHAHGLRIVGPNCMGLLNANADVRMNGTFSQVFPQPGRIAFSSQSGAMGLAVLDHVDRLGLGISTFVSVGNKADISGNDLLLYWEDDADTDVVLLYLESFGNPRRFSRIARRISYRKPIVAVKSGRTSAGRRAASSHTAALSSGDVTVDALFRQTGVIRTETLEELFDVAALLTTQPLPRGPRVAILTNAGGPGILAADACESNGLSVPALSEQTQAQLREFLPAEAGVGNPVDMIASGSAEQYGRALRVLGNAEEVDAVIVIFIPPVVTRPEDVAHALVTAASELPRDRVVLSVFMSARGVPPELAQARIPSYVFPEGAARALGRVTKYAAWRAQPQGEVIDPDGIDRDGARAVVEAALSAAAAGPDSTPLVGHSHASAATETSAAEPGRADTWLNAAEAAAVLAAYGVRFVRTVQVTSAEQAAWAQTHMAGPVALKLAAPVHKTDVGGIRLNLTTPEDTAAAFEQMRAALIDNGLGDYADAFLVQEMMSGGVEMVVGVSSDPSFGPVIMTGFGGTLVELHQDVAVRVTPVTDRDVDEMLRSLKAYRLLTGYRGAPATDIAALKDLVHRVNAMVEDLPEIAELDLNPVFVHEEGVTAVDVRLRVRAAAPGRRTR